MHSDPSDDHQPCRYFSAYWQAQHAANASTPEDHVWQLEWALDALCRHGTPAEITPRERDCLHDNLRAARTTTKRLLAGRYAPEQIELGYRAAHGVVTAWAVPIDERRKVNPHSACHPILTCFRADIGNMRRMNGLQRAPGVALGDLLPPLPRVPRDDEGATILSFPEF